MGRPSKNPNHILVRLRKQLSTENRQCTRTDLAKKTGVPEPTLKDIEVGKFRLTAEMAISIAFGTGASPGSLLRADNPVLDHFGNPVNSGTVSISPFWSHLLYEANRQLFSAAFEAAHECEIGFLFLFSFNAWLYKTVKQFEKIGLRSALSEKLTARLKFFDPHQMGDMFWPKDATEWKKQEEKISALQQKLMAASTPEDKMDIANAFPGVTLSEETQQNIQEAITRRIALERTSPNSAHGNASWDLETKRQKRAKVKKIVERHCHKATPDVTESGQLIAES